MTPARTWIVDLTSGGPLLPLSEGPRDDGVGDVHPVPTCGRTDSTSLARPCRGRPGSPGLSDGAALRAKGHQPQGPNTPGSTAGSGPQAACVTGHTQQPELLGVLKSHRFQRVWHSLPAWHHAPAGCGESWPQDTGGTGTCRRRRTPWGLVPTQRVFSSTVHPVKEAEQWAPAPGCRDSQTQTTGVERAQRNPPLARQPCLPAYPSGPRCRQPSQRAARTR